MAQPAPGTGNWRLQLESSLDIEVLAYVRTKDGFLTSMHERVPRVGDGYRLATFNPGDNPRQKSILRLINTGLDGDRHVVIEGIDDRGQAPGGTAWAYVPSGAARNVTALELERGAEDLVGTIGNGVGKWQLIVTADPKIQVVNLLESPTGHLTNLSTAPDLERREPAVRDGIGISGQRIVTRTRSDVYVRDATAVDLDGDADLDVVAAIEDRYDGSRIGWYANLGGVSFSEERRIAGGFEGAGAVAAFDVDADGDADIAYAAGDGYDDDDFIAWRENLGNGKFSDEILLGDKGNDDWKDVIGADIDADGDADLLGASFAANRLVWFENEGGSFSSEHEIEAALGETRTLVVSDLDGDGDSDIAYVGSEDVVWQENLGGGSFAGARIVADRFASALAAADIDGDGDPDLVLSSRAHDEVGWLENEGAGRFAEYAVIAEDAYNAGPVAASDMDGDGMVDLVCRCGTDGEIAWIRNAGGGDFAAPRVVSSQIDAVFLGPADMDGDGDPDLLAVDGGGSRSVIAWYENLGEVVETVDFRVAVGVGQMQVTWRAIGGAGDDSVRYTYRVTAVSEDGKDRGTCIATVTQGCTVTGLLPGATYQVTVEVEGGALRSATRSVTPLTDPPSTTEMSAARLLVEADYSRSIDGLEPLDIDGDGDLDLLYYQPVAWRENLGNGEFSDEKTIITDSVSAIEISDLDGDGAP